MLGTPYSTLLGLNLKSMRGIYDLWGPSARYCIRLLDDNDLQFHVGQVTSAVAAFTKDFTRYDKLEEALSLASHGLLVVEPTKESKQRETLRFASKHVLALVARAYASRDSALRQTFYKTLSGHSRFGASLGRIFETSALLWVSRYWSYVIDINW
jgi:hypothetical protein